MDGEYLFKFSLLKVNFGPQYGGAAKDEQLEMSVNGERVLLRDLPSTTYLLHPRRRSRSRRWRWACGGQAGRARRWRRLGPGDGERPGGGA